MKLGKYYLLCVLYLLSLSIFSFPSDTLLFPQRNATLVPANVRLQIYFNEPMQKGTGNIQIFDATTSVQIFSIPVTCSCVVITGNKVSITMPSLLSAGQQVYVIMANGTFKNLYNEPFMGFQLPTDWRFTVALGLITNQNFVPANGNDCVALEQRTFQMILSGAVLSNNATPNWIRIFETNTDQLHEEIQVSSSQVIANNSNVVSFTINIPLREATSYYVLISPVAFLGAGSSVYEGIYDKTTWQFVTAQSKPQTQDFFVCGASEVLLRASPPNNLPTTSYQYRWYKNATGGEPIRNANGQIVSSDTLRVFVQNTTAFYVSLWSGGCESQRSPLNVSVKPLPISTLPPEEIKVGKGIPISLEANGGIKYTWEPATGLSNPNISNPELIAQENITYTVTIENAQGCSLQRQVRVIIDDSEKDIFLPTVFSPNDDGIHDFFRIRGKNIAEIDWSIYDRNGKIVYRTSQVQEALNKGWDGTYNNVPQPQDTYIWTLKGKFSDGSPLPQKAGSVLLIR